MSWSWCRSLGNQADLGMVQDQDQDNHLVFKLVLVITTRLITITDSVIHLHCLKRLQSEVCLSSIYLLCVLELREYIYSY